MLAQPVAADFSGRISVVDGDTIHVGETKVRVHGIDAPEVDQTCVGTNGNPWMCGAFVQAEVYDLYHGKLADCEELDRDRYGRSVAKCYVDGQDIGENIVLNGWAEAYRQYSLDYDLAEKSAQIRAAGVWAGSMQSPSSYRAEQRIAPIQVAPTDGCIIKGNISGSGRIYHMPHNRDYTNTRINTDNGERWFCSEREAEQAGWRAARN